MIVSQDLETSDELENMSPSHDCTTSQVKPSDISASESVLKGLSLLCVNFFILLGLVKVNIHDTSRATCCSMLIFHCFSTGKTLERLSLMFCECRSVTEVKMALCSM